MKPHPPMSQIMDIASRPARLEGRHPDLHLLRDCLALSRSPRPSARIRLEEAVGEELARKLLSSVGSLTPSARR
jgi:hypothetical protein